MIAVEQPGASERQPSPLGQASALHIESGRADTVSYRGVTKSRNASDGMNKYDVQCVFSDAGSKKHPKVYGFADQEAAARAFDILILRRSIEKHRIIDPKLLGNEFILGNNYPLSDYQDPALIALIKSSSRDDIVYGLKHAAKQGLELTIKSIFQDMTDSIAAATEEAEQKLQLGEPRPSYAPNADTKKRQMASVSTAQKGKKTKKNSSPSVDMVQESQDPMQTIILPSHPTITDPAALASMQLIQMLPLPLPAVAGEAAKDENDGLLFLLEICKSATRLHPELVCLIDLLRLWDSMQSNSVIRDGTSTRSITDIQLFLPIHYYQNYIDKLSGCLDLRSALRVCHAASRSGLLRDYWSMYNSTFGSSHELNMNDEPAANGGSLDNGKDFIEVQRQHQRQQLNQIQSHQQALANQGDESGSQMVQVLLNMATGGASTIPSAFGSPAGAPTSPAVATAQTVKQLNNTQANFLHPDDIGSPVLMELPNIDSLPSTYLN